MSVIRKLTGEYIEVKIAMFSKLVDQRVKHIRHRRRIDLSCLIAAIPLEVLVTALKVEQLDAEECIAAYEHLDDVIAGILDGIVKSEEA